MSVVDLNKARIERNPHIAGVAECIGCQHQWVATVPASIKTHWLECPECHAPKGRFVAPVLLGEGIERKECSCGCQAFSVTRSELICMNCGQASDR